MTKKIGKIIMVTAIVVFFAFVACIAVFAVTESTDEYELLESLYESEDLTAEEFNDCWEKYLTQLIVNALIGILISYISCIILCGYGRLIQDNYEKAQAAKEINLILRKQMQCKLDDLIIRSSEAFKEENN